MQPKSTHYTAHFSRRELACRCGCDTPPLVAENLAQLAVHLEALRAALGCPVTVHCAYRCPAHNAAIGGAKNSQHMYGTACDFSTKKHTHKQAFKVAETISRFREGGMHAYSWGVHVDIGPGPRRW
jgi:uncharacterized protein YcbK (DUF882 family)